MDEGGVSMKAVWLVIGLICLPYCKPDGFDVCVQMCKWVEDRSAHCGLVCRQNQIDVESMKRTYSELDLSYNKTRAEIRRWLRGVNSYTSYNGNSSFQSQFESS